MTATAIIAQRDTLVARGGAVGGGEGRWVKAWYISWKGDAGQFSSDLTYASANDAESMARWCGAKVVERPPAP